jgi:hypothetical protein
VLATRGDPATIPGEKPLSFKLAALLEVTEKKKARSLRRQCD